MISGCDGHLTHTSELDSVLLVIATAIELDWKVDWFDNKIQAQAQKGLSWGVFWVETLRSEHQPWNLVSHQTDGPLWNFPTVISGICQFSTTTVLEFTVLEFNFFFFPEFEVIYILIKFSFALKQYFFFLRHVLCLVYIRWNYLRMNSSSPISEISWINFYAYHLARSSPFY